MPHALQSVDLNLPQWIGATELQPVEDGLKPWWLPTRLLPFLDVRTRFQAGNPSGVRLRLATTSTTLELEVLPEEKEQRWFDLTSDDTLLGRVTLEPGQTLVRFAGLPATSKTLELWLNHMYTPVVVRALRVDGDAAVSQAPPTGRKRILFHGSSISHGRQADGPSESWTMGAARLAQLDPVNLGLGGACQLEPIVATFLRDQPADYINLCLGVNVVLGAFMAPRSFRAGVIGLIDRIRERHPVTPIAVQSGIYVDKPAETTLNGAGMSMQTSRAVVKEVVELFITHGDRKLMYTDGLSLFGPADASMLFDQLHPDGQGHRLFSQRWHDIVWPELRRLG